MKKLLLLVTVILSFSVAKAQTTILVDGFLGVKFATAPEAATAAMIRKGGILDHKSSKKNFYIFTNVMFGNRKPEYVYFRYSNDKMYEAGAYFRPEPPNQAIVLYSSVKNDISLTYGEGTNGSRVPSTYNDGENEIAAIELGNAVYSTKWMEDPRLSRFNTIELVINQDLVTHLRLTEAKQGRK